MRVMLSGAWQTTKMDDALWHRIENALADYKGPRENGGQSPALQAMRELGMWHGERYPGGRERLEQRIGSVQQTYTVEEVARIVGKTGRRGQ